MVTNIKQLPVLFVNGVAQPDFYETVAAAVEDAREINYQSGQHTKVTQVFFEQPEVVAEFVG